MKTPQKLNHSTSFLARQYNFLAIITWLVASGAGLHSLWEYKVNIANWKRKLDFTLVSYENLWELLLFLLWEGILFVFFDKAFAFLPHWPLGDVQTPCIHTCINAHISSNRRGLKRRRELRVYSGRIRVLIGAGAFLFSTQRVCMRVSLHIPGRSRLLLSLAAATDAHINMSSTVWSHGTTASPNWTACGHRKALSLLAREGGTC